MDKIKIYFDMDGVLAEFNQIDSIEKLYEKDYFRNLLPLENVVDSIKMLFHQINANNEMEVFVLSSVLKDSPYALSEKNEWLDHYLPEIDQEHRIFIDYGGSKAEVLHNFGKNCVLVDDYTPNLRDWNQKGGIAIKMINPINNTTRSWEGLTIDHSLNPTIMAYSLKKLIVESYIQKISIKERVKKAAAKKVQNKSKTARTLNLEKGLVK